MSALKNMPISFPGLFGDWELNIDPVAIHIGHGIYWYGIILAFAMLAGLYLCMKQAKHYGLTEDNIMDMVLWAVPCCIIGARFYYVLFYLDLYRNTDGSLDWGAMFRIWDGGLAIYGAVIAGVLVALVYTKRHKLPFFAMGDVAVMGLLLGQIIGRWANFINREAFGGETTLPWRMKLWVSQYTSIEVHPTFFYESFWNLIGLLLILFIVSKGRRFDGENTWFYFLWYGLGRSWIEGLRTDSLYLFNWELFGQRSGCLQALSIVMVAVAAFMLFYNIRIKKRSPETCGSIRWRQKSASGRCRSGGRLLAETLMTGGGALLWSWRPLTPRPVQIRKHRRKPGKGRDAWQRELTERLLAAKVKAQVAGESELLPRQPGLAVVLVGEDPPRRSMSGVRKRTAGESAASAAFPTGFRRRPPSGSCWTSLKN